MAKQSKTTAPRSATWVDNDGDELRCLLGVCGKDDLDIELPQDIDWLTARGEEQIVKLRTWALSLVAMCDHLLAKLKGGG